MTLTIGEMIAQAANSILAAQRATGHRPPGLVGEVRPRNLAQAYGIQAAVSNRSGVVGGWQICRPSVQVELACAQVPLASMGRSLPDYDAPYTREHIRAAIESCHPAVAVLQPPPIDPDPPDRSSDVATGC